MIWDITTREKEGMYDKKTERTRVMGVILSRLRNAIEAVVPFLRFGRARGRARRGRFEYRTPATPRLSVVCIPVSP